MHAKFTLKYSYVGSEDYSPMDITFEIPGDANIDQMLFNFECFMKACGFVFDGKFVQSFPQDELDGTLYEFEDEPQGGCMADFDKECGCESTSSPLESKNEKLLREWNEGIAKLDNEQLQKAMKQAHEMSGLHYEATKEVKKNNWVHGMCNPPADDAKEYVKDCKSTGKKYNSVDAMLKHLMKK